MAYMRQQQQQWGDDIRAPVPPSPRPWLELLWLAVRGGLPTPGPPLPCPLLRQLLGGSTHFFLQETEAHGEEEAGRGGCRSGRKVITMETEVRRGEALAWRPQDSPPTPTLGRDEEATPSCSIGEKRWRLRLRGPEVGRGMGLSRSRASRCAPSHILAQRPHT